MYESPTEDVAMEGKYLETLHPCGECPFRKRSLPGWLGLWEPRELLRWLSYEPFPCHQTLVGDWDDVRGCAGAAVYLNNKLEISRRPETAAHQEVVRDVAEGESVFANAAEFLSHHLEPYEKSKGGVKAHG